jgi:signal peptidase II
MPAKQRKEIVAFPPSIRSCTAALVCAGVVLIDQITKYYALTLLSPAASRPVIDGVFHYTLVFNTGTAFGLFKDMTFVFIGITVGVCSCVFVALFGSRGRTLPYPEVVALACILGGALGNLIDRIRFGYVVDFLDFRVWPVFNVADSAITCGAALLIVSVIRQTKSKPESH